MKNSADLGGCYPPQPSASVDNIPLDLQNSSYPTQPHAMIAKYMVYHISNLSWEGRVQRMQAPSFCRDSFLLFKRNVKLM